MTPREQLEQLRAELRPESIVGLAVAGVALLALASWLYALAPALDAHRAAAKARSEVGEAESAPGVELALIAKRESEIAALRTRLYGNAADVPEPQREAHVIDALNRTASRHAVALESVKPGTPGQVLEFEELPYDVRVEGPFFQLYDWFRDVEDELRPMVVKEFHLAPASEEGLVRLELRVVAYRPEHGP